MFNLQLTAPSIARIRAQFIMEKMGTIAQPCPTCGCEQAAKEGICTICGAPLSKRLNIFVTGRTGSGKTTLGNHLLGIDYFLSTGRQDCTQEINLIEFPVGLNYFDLPGVCSDDRLENFNRVALGLEQSAEFPTVADLVLAKYTEGQAPQVDSLPLAAYQAASFQPDLIVYLIAPDKLFGRSDRKYLRALLERHQTVIYVLNMFVDPQNEGVYAASEANVSDTVQQIHHLHHSLFGDQNQPIMVGANCRSGEGIAELMARTRALLGSEKGALFAGLVDYQRSKTPAEYVRQVKAELARLLAYTAHLQPTGEQHGEQALHHACQALWRYLAAVQKESAQSSSPVSLLVERLADAAVTNPTDSALARNQDHPLTREAIFQGIGLLDGWITHLNQQLIPPLHTEQTAIIDWRNKEYAVFTAEVEAVETTMQAEKAEIAALIEAWQSINTETDVLEAEIEQRKTAFQRRVAEYDAQSTELSNRARRYDDRQERWVERAKSYNATIEQLKRGYGRASTSVLRTLEAESDYLDEEQSRLESDLKALQKLHGRLQTEETALTEEGEVLHQRIEFYHARFQVYEQQTSTLQEKLKRHQRCTKESDEALALWSLALDKLEEALQTLLTVKAQRVAAINARIEEIAERFHRFTTEESFWTAEESEQISQEIDRCLYEMQAFAAEVARFRSDLQRYQHEVQMNYHANALIKQCTVHHFDDSALYAYQGSTYQPFGKEGVILLLTLAYLLVTGGNITTDFTTMQTTIAKQMKRLGAFPTTATEQKLRQWLEMHTASWLDQPLEQAMHQLAPTEACRQ